MTLAKHYMLEEYLDIYLSSPHKNRLLFDHSLSGLSVCANINNCFPIL